MKTKEKMLDWIEKAKGKKKKKKKMLKKDNPPTSHTNVEDEVENAKPSQRSVHDDRKRTTPVLKAMQDWVSKAKGKKHPFSMSDKKGGLTFHHHDTGKEIKHYAGPFHPGGDKSTVMHTWHEGGERAFGMNPKGKKKKCY